MIDLAPHNPYSLTLQSPVIIASGCATDLRALDPAMIGAVVTPTATRHGVDERTIRWGSVPAGVVIERLPTVRLRTLLQSEAKRWERSPVPVLLSLRGAAAELDEMLARLGELESVAGLVVQSDEPVETYADGVAAVRNHTMLPLLGVLPPSADPDQAVSLVQAGADALIVAAYPPAVASTGADFIEGVLVGPTLAPWTLRAIRRIRTVLDQPIVALGGVADGTIARQCLAAGASAVLIDGALYGDPDAPQRIAAEL